MPLVILTSSFPLDYKTQKSLFSKAGPSQAGRWSEEGQDGILLSMEGRERLETNIHELVPSYQVLHVHPLEIHSQGVESWVLLW